MAHWTRDLGNNGGPDPLRQLVRRYDSNGQSMGAELRVDAERSSFEPASDVALRPGGGFFVAWAGPAEGTITAQAYDALDNKEGPELVVRALGGSEIFADIDVAVNRDDTRMVVWTEDEFFFDFPHVLGRAYDPAGSPISPAFSVDGDPAFQYTGNEVLADQRGDFVVSWARIADDTAFAQTFSPAGVRLDDVVEVATDIGSSGGRIGMRLTELRGAGAGFAYIGDNPAGGGRLPFLQPLSVGAVFADGFESGDTSAWSQTIP